MRCMKPLHALLASCTFLLASCGGGSMPEENDETFEPMEADIVSNDSVTLANGSVPSAPGATQVVFSGHTFQVRSGAGGPGPNAWSEQNVWVDANGWLHLKIANQAGVWSCAEVYTTDALGFGTYTFKVIGHPETLDRNVVLGLFNYPTPDVGPDGTNELDIEFATWGGAQPQHGNFTVWSATAGAPTTHAFDFANPKGVSTHRFAWSAKQVQYQSMNARWNFAPRDAANLVPQHAMPLHMNFWLFQGQAPSDAQEAEIVISEFLFTPSRKSR
jgi:hypothetical protein